MSRFTGRCTGRHITRPHPGQRVEERERSGRAGPGRAHLDQAGRLLQGPHRAGAVRLRGRDARARGRRAAGEGGEALAAGARARGAVGAGGADAGGGVVEEGGGVLELALRGGPCTCYCNYYKIIISFLILL